MDLSMIQEKELIIIGGGPAGLKAAEEAENWGIDYLILEKGKVGQAWRELRPEMKMLSTCHPQRDWTSLSNKFPIWKKEITRPFCSVYEFVNYLKDFCDHFNLKIKTYTKIEKIVYKNGKFILTTKKEEYHAKCLLIATGILGNPYYPDIPGLKGNPIVNHSHYFKSYRLYRSKRVVIVGGGNSAAEIALELSGYSQVYLITKSELHFFSKTQNLCHIRGISESFLLEQIRMGIIHLISNARIDKIEDYKLYIKNKTIETKAIICATGYSPVLGMLNSFNLKLYKNKFPRVTSTGESVNIPNLYFTGPLIHNPMSNLFIHGFIKTVPITISEIHRRITNKI